MSVCQLSNCRGGAVGNVRFRGRSGHAVCAAHARLPKADITRRSNLHSSSFFALVALTPILWPLHSGGDFIGGLVSFPILTTGALPRILGLTSVLRLARYRLGCCRRRSCCRWSCGWLSSGTFSPTFCNVVFFRDLGRLICRLVSSPFLLARFDRFLLSQRRRCRKGRN